METVIEIHTPTSIPHKMQKDTGLQGCIDSYNNWEQSCLPNMLSNTMVVILSAVSMLLSIKVGMAVLAVGSLRKKVYNVLSCSQGRRWVRGVLGFV